MEPGEGSHPDPIASVSQAAGLLAVVLFTVVALGAGVAWPAALYMTFTLPPSGQQRRVRRAWPAGGRGRR